MAKGCPGGVIIIGDERQMTRILDFFGEADESQRTEPQMLLAVPCTLCEADNILKITSGGISDKVKKLGQDLREVQVAVRAYHLKQAVQELGPDLLRMDDFYVLSSVTLPYTWEEVGAVTGWTKKWRRDIC